MDPAFDENPRDTEDRLPLSIRIHHVDDATVLTVCGDFTKPKNDVFEEVIRHILKFDHLYVAVIMNDIDRFDSAGLALLLQARTELTERGGKLALCTTSLLVQSFLNIAGISPVLGYCQSLEEAMAELERSQGAADVRQLQPA